MISDARTTPAPDRQPPPSQAVVGVVVAMEAELRHLLERVEVERETVDGPWRDRHLAIDGMPVVALCCGMGMVNAAAGAEHLIATYHPSALLNFGCSGAHTREIAPGDVVIADATVHHAALHILADGSEHFVGSRYEVGGETMSAAEFAADPTLLALASAAAAAATLDPWPQELGWPAALPYRAPTVHHGVVASADTWTQAIDRLDRLHARHRSLCEEMEAAAIAHVAARHAVPFLAIKDISNNEFHAASDIVGGFSDFPIEEVGKRAAAVTYGVLQRLAATPVTGNRASDRPSG